MNKYCVTNGDLYSNGVANEMKISNLTGVDIRVKASGTGSCKLVGKLTANGEYKTLSLVRLSDFAVVETIADDNIYAADVSGIHTITVQDVSGFTNVWATVLA